MTPESKFKLEVDLDNDAFKSNPRNELADLLEDVACEIRKGVFCSSGVFDTNGNRVGTLSIQSDSEKPPARISMVERCEQ